MEKEVAAQSQTTDSNPEKSTLIRVLHVDDDADFLVISKRLLGRQGSFQVECVTSVKQAMKKLEQESYDVIVSDYRLLGRNGLEFYTELRDKGNSFPFFLLTGEPRNEIADDAFNMGVDRCFSKNEKVELVFGELASAIKEAIRSGTKNAE